MGRNSDQTECVTFLMGAVAFGLIAARTARSLAAGPGFPPLSDLPLACAKIFFGIAISILNGRAGTGSLEGTGFLKISVEGPDCWVIGDGWGEG
jgi:hypothetical protein